MFRNPEISIEEANDSIQFTFHYPTVFSNDSIQFTFHYSTVFFIYEYCSRIVMNPYILYSIFIL